jgi:hypothetical protein
MPKKRTHAFHFPLQAVSPRKQDTTGTGLGDEGWDEEALPIEYGVESPTIPPPVAFAPIGRGSTNSNGTEGARGSKRLTM